MTGDLTRDTTDHPLTKLQKDVLGALDEQGGFTTGRIAKCLPRSFAGPTRNRIFSKSVRRTLLALQDRGYVRTLDDQKPVCWCRTPAGTAAILQ
jgi:hypothetical protein